VLYQDVAIDEAGGFHGSRRFEQEVLKLLESAYERVDDQLGLRPRHKIDVVIYDPAVFDQQFAGRFRFQAAGAYNGVIYIRGDVRVTDELYRVLHHELVHAALDAHAPSFAYPAWLNEGTAEWVEARALGQRGLNGGQFAYLARAQRAGGLPPLAALSGVSFANMDGRTASLAYLQSYAFVAFLVHEGGERSLRDLFDGIETSRNLERTVRRVYRADLESLEAQFRAGFGS